MHQVIAASTVVSLNGEPHVNRAKTECVFMVAFKPWMIKGHRACLRDMSYFFLLLVLSDVVTNKVMEGRVYL